MLRAVLPNDRADGHEPSMTRVRSRPSRRSCSAPASPGSSPPTSCAAAGVEPLVYEAGPKVAGMAESHNDPDGFSYDTGAHFITNRLATAIGVNNQCRTVRRYGETVYGADGEVAGYPFGLLRTPRYVRVGARGQGPGTRGRGRARHGRGLLPGRVRRGAGRRGGAAADRGLVGRSRRPTGRRGRPEDPHEHHPDDGAQGCGQGHQAGGRHRLLQREAPERRRLARVPRGRRQPAVRDPGRRAG